MNIPAPFSENQYRYFRDTFHSWFNVAEGGKRGGKNIVQIASFGLHLESHPDRLHLVAGIDVSAARLNVIDSNGYGLLNMFEGRCREGKYKDMNAFFVQTHTGEKIVLIAGLGNSRGQDDIAGNSYGMVMVTEANRCHREGVKEATDRTIASKNRKVFHDINPRAEGHPYYKDVLDYHTAQQLTNPDYGYNYGHFNMLDNMALTKEQIRQVISTYDKKSAWYQRDILGKRMALEGLIYPQFNYDFHVVPTIPRPYSTYYVSVDYGTQNATSIALWGLADGIYYRIDEYYHSGRDTGSQKTASKYFHEMRKLVGNRQIDSVIVDPSASHFIAEIREHSDWWVRKANNDVMKGILEVGEALDAGIIKVNDCCKQIIRDMGLYSWDPKSVEDQPQKSNDHGHAADDFRYFVATEKILKFR